MSNLIKKPASPNRGGQSGEIILVILLIMAVGLTIGLSVAGRSLTDVRLSTQIDESSRAFSAAEAGIESVLSLGLYGAGSASGPIGDSNYDVSVAALGASSSIFAFPTALEDGDAQTIWLVNHGANGPVEARTYTQNSIEVCWGDETATVPAIEVSVLFKSGSNYKVARAGFDSNKAGRSGSANNFLDPDSGACSQQAAGYNHHTTVTFVSLDPLVPINMVTDTLLALRLRPVYASAKIAVVPSGGATLPEQGKNISSVGKSGSGVSRRWNVVQTYSAPTDLFDYAVWSNTNLEK